MAAVISMRSRGRDRGIGAVTRHAFFALFQELYGSPLPCMFLSPHEKVSSMFSLSYALVLMDTARKRIARIDAPVPMR
jgi:hypothetical protein